MTAMFSVCACDSQTGNLVLSDPGWPSCLKFQVSKGEIGREGRRGKGGEKEVRKQERKERRKKGSKKGS